MHFYDILYVCPKLKKLEGGSNPWNIHSSRGKHPTHNTNRQNMNEKVFKLQSFIKDVGTNLQNWAK